MARYLITHSLLSSWLYALKGKPYEDATTERDSLQEFLTVLRREPKDTTEAMQNGIDFENLVDAVTRGSGDLNDKWYEAAYKVAQRVQGGIPQMRISKQVTVNGHIIVLHGRPDWLKAGEIFDVKFTKNYDPGKYFSSTQHPMYFALVPESNRFTYLASNGSSVWPETYRRDEAPSIIPTIAEFLDWLTATGYMDLYQKHWVAK